MSYFPQRTFIGVQGEPSIDLQGPEALKHDLDELAKMFDPNATHGDGSHGGISEDNFDFSFDDETFAEKIGAEPRYTGDGITVQEQLDNDYATALTHFKNGSYDANTGKITLTKENGETVEITIMPSGILETAHGGTGNADGYIRTGKQAGSVIGSNATVEGLDNVASGEYSHAEGINNQATAYGAHAEGAGYSVASGVGSHAEGSGIASGNRAHAEGTSIANGDYSHAEGVSTANGDYSHTEGVNNTTTLNGAYGHAEGQSNIVSAPNGHAEGLSNTSSGQNSHVGGRLSTASGLKAFAHGFQTEASGENSVTFGEGTKATHRSQVAIGEYNALDPSTASASNKGNYAFIIGNGLTEGYRRNAATVDWTGNGTLAGKLTVGAAPENEFDVATKKYVDDFITFATDAEIQNIIDSY